MERQTLLCAPLKLDAFQRAIMPIAVVALVLFGCVWLGLVLWMTSMNERMLREGVLRTAEIFEEYPAFTTSTGEVIRFLKARHPSGSGKYVSFDIPKNIERAPGVTFEVLQYQDQYALPEHAKQQQWMGWVMALVGLTPFLIAYRSIKTSRQENQRIERLKKQNDRVPAHSFRVRTGQEKLAGSMSRVFCVHVKFEHNGKLYEACSKSFSEDPSAVINLERLAILLDRRDPLQSLIAPDSLPSERDLREAKGKNSS